MFTGDSIGKFIKALQIRRVSFYHACQLKDLESYLALGGIPARGLLADKGLDFTKFASDGNDSKTGDWNRVFLNMSDFGGFFHNGSNSTPNVYGPILFKLDPDCIESCDDVAVCLCSAGSDGYDRSAFAIKDTRDIDKLFANTTGMGPKSTWLQYTTILKKLFTDIPVKGAPEVSCTSTDRLISLDYVTSVLVDPLVHNGFDLHAEVASKLSSHHEILGSMAKRQSKKQERYLSLVSNVAAGHVRLKDVAGDSDLEEWKNGLLKNDLGWQYERFAEYLLTGTLSRLKSA